MVGSSAGGCGSWVRCCMARGCGGARSEVVDKAMAERWCGGRLKVGGVGVSSPRPRVWAKVKGVVSSVVLPCSREVVSE
jgi:hypothetical protein